VYADLKKQRTMKHAYKHTFTLLVIAALALFSHGTLIRPRTMALSPVHCPGH
jgi:hypothetical protein